VATLQMCICLGDHLIGKNGKPEGFRFTSSRQKASVANCELHMGNYVASAVLSAKLRLLVP